MADLVEIAAVKVKGGEDRRPLVDVRQPGPADRRQPDARHHRQGRQGRAEPDGGRRQAARLRRRRARRRPQRRLRPRLPRGGAGRRDPLRAGHATSTRSSIAREGYPDAENYKLGTLARFFGIELTQSHRALPDAEATANLLLWFANDLPGPDLRRSRTAIADAVRANRDRRRHREAARGGPPRGARQQGPVRARPEEDRPRARPRRGHPDGRPRPDRHPPDLGRGRAPAARPRLRPVHPRRDPGADGRDARLVLGRPADRHDQPGDREALPPPLQLPAVQHRREQDDARARAGATSATATSPSGRWSRSCRTHEEFPYVIRLVSECVDLERLDVDGLDVRLDARPDGRRRADQGAGRRRGDGPDHASRTAASPS